MNIVLHFWKLLIFLIAEKPSIDVSKIKDITVKAGQDIKIALPLKGWPVPTANWKNGDNDLVKDDRTKIEVRKVRMWLYAREHRGMDVIFARISKTNIIN